MYGEMAIKNRHSFSNCYLIHEKRLSGDSRMFCFLSMIITFFPSWWSVCAIHHQSSLHVNYWATYRVVLCVMQEKGQMRPLPTSVRWLFGKKFPLQNSFVSFSFLSLYFKTITQLAVRFFYVRLKQPRFAVNENAQHFHFFSLLKNSPQRKNIGALHKILLRIPANNKV
jgi:hypothetical protein